MNQAMEEEMIAVVKNELTQVIREVGLDPDVIKAKSKSCVTEVLRELEINEEHIRLISRTTIRGSLDAAKETESDSAFVGRYTAKGILEMIREFNEKSAEYITAAQNELKEAFKNAADSSKEETVARSLRELIGTTNSMWPPKL